MGEVEDVDLGVWLVQRRAGLDQAEAEWLEQLARFDRDGLWAADGQLCCANWLMWRTNMARSTAFEKLRVAHELARRPIIAAAFRSGQLSYSAVRALTRMDRPDPELDQTLVELAVTGRAAIADLERVARTYMLYADQERPPAPDPQTRRDVKIRRGSDGTGQIIVTLSDLETEQFAATLQAFLDQRYRPQPVDESSTEDLPVDESSAEDPPVPEEAPLEQAGRAALKADAFMDLLDTALAAADSGHATGDDRYSVHLVSHHPDQHILTLADGTPLHPADTATINCDHATIAHHLGPGAEPLNLGRRTRQWNTAQRRAITIRDAGHCRFPGCQHTHTDIHHIQPWQSGGPTNIDNAINQCRRHHRMLHTGYQIQGNPNHQLHFYRPDGTYIGATHPAPARTPAALPGIT